MISSKFWKPSEKNFVPNPKVMHKLGKKPAGGKFMKVFGVIFGFICLLTVGIGLVAYLVVVRPVQAVLGDATVLNDDITQLKAAFVDRDLVTVGKMLDKTEKDLEVLRTSRDAKLSWMQKFGPLASYYTDSDHFIDAGLHLVKATEETVVLIEPFADAAGLRVSEDQEVVTTSLVEAFSNWVAVMPQVAEGADSVILELTKAGDELAKVDASKYPEKIRGTEIRAPIVLAQKALTQLNDAAPDIKQALTIIPGLLGVDTAERRYMIIMQNDKELRPTGGFWTNYATFKINNAMLSSDFTSKDMYSIDITLDAIDYYFDFPDAPPAYTKYLKVEHWFARDTNSSPDFPTSLDNFMYFYNMAGRVAPLEVKPVDGVFAIDTQVISELLEVTGPVTVNGVTYTSDNVVLELEKIASLTLQQQAGRKRVLGYLMQAMLINVFESESNLWPRLIEKGVDLAIRKHVLAFSFDPTAQALLEKYGLAGRIKDPVEGDYACVVSTNLGGDKTNWFVTKTVNHTLEKDGDKWLRTVAIKYNYPTPGEDYSSFVKRFRDWVRVYVPEGSTLISVTGSADSFGEATERGKVYFDGYTELGPGETTEMVFKYTLPANAVSGNVYKLLVQKQPGIDKETHSVTVNGKTETLELTRDHVFEIKL